MSATTRVRVRVLAMAGALVAFSGVAVAARAAADPAPPGVGPLDAPDSGRIVFAGTAHRSMGVLTGPVGGVPGPTLPLLGGGPAHADDHPAARADLVVFTSLRDGPAAQVYLREADGAVRALSSGRDAAHPRLSPDLRTVVFDSAEPAGSGTGGGAGSQRDLWLVGTDGTGLRRLTDTPADEVWPTFSPDGRSVAFASDRGGDWEIYARPVAGGPARQLTDEPGPAAALQPAWNPVGDPAHRDRVAFTVDLGEGSTPRLQVRLTDGGGPGVPVLGGDQQFWQGSQPAWLPDGDRLLLLSPNQACTCVDDGIERVYRVDTAAGLPVTAAPELLLDENRAVTSPTWLVDAAGEHLVVARTTAADANTATLQDIRPDGADPRDLGLPILREDPRTDPAGDPLFNPRPGFDPWTVRQNYSPDGRLIALSRFQDAGGQRVQRIWLVNPDGSDPRELPVADRSPADWETDATWSPDGRLIAFVRQSPGGLGPDAGPRRIVVVEVATGSVVAALPPRGDLDDAQPVWSPDGTAVAFTRVTPAGAKHIWVARFDGSGGSGGLDRQRDLSAAVCGSDCDVIDDSPAFSPDGTAVAFNRKDDAVLLADAAGTGCRVLLPAGQDSCAAPVTAPAGPFQPRDVAFSPDGGHLVLSSRRAAALDSPEALAVLDLATGQLRQLTAALAGRQKEPSWQQVVDLAVTAPPAAPAVPVGEAVPVTVTVVNHGPAPSPGSTLTLTVPPAVRVDGLRPARGSCDTAAGACELGLLEPGATVTVTADLTGTAPGVAPVDWTARGAVLDVRPADNTARTLLAVLAGGAPPLPPPAPAPPPAVPPPAPPAPPASPGLSVAARPNPGFVGGQVGVTFTARNRGARPATGLRLDLGLPAGIPVAALPPGCTPTGCALGTLPPGGSRTVVVVFAPDAAIRADVLGTLRTTGTDADPADNTAAAALRVLQPRVVAVPPIGEPGFVTSVRGLDFPPGTPVRLRWTPGITVPAAPAVPRADGSFTAQLLILPKDQTGPRVITASGPGFSPVTTGFLVVVGTIGPPTMAERR